jgi:ABC-type multidrug transport system permease subunit
MSLALAAISMTLLGLQAVASWPGLGSGILTMLLLGMPLSGAQSAPELLPQFWARLGQALPSGAAGQLLRSDAYFDGRGATSALVVLSCWAVAGLILALLPTRRGRHT